MLDIASDVASTLKQLFPGVPVIRELGDDGSFTPPCFYVEQAQTTAQPKPGSEQVREYSFDVAYLLDENDPQLAWKLQTAQDTLLSQLMHITDDRGKPLAHPWGQSTRIVDKVLHYQFSLSLRVQDDTSVPLMPPTLQVNGEDNG